MASETYDPEAFAVPAPPRPTRSPYQRMVLAALDLGPLTSKQVSERASLPRGVTYRVLSDLAKRGLVELRPRTHTTPELWAICT